MTKQPSDEDKDKPVETESPTPEVLQIQSEETESVTASDIPAKPKILKPRHAIYRPSHKATFIGLGIVVLILLVNVGIVFYLMQTQGKNNSEVSIGGIKISPAVLDTLGVSRNTIGTSGTELVVNPNARFSGTVTIGGNTSVAGQFNLNGKITASDTSFTKLQAGDTALNTLNVNGDATATNLNLRKDLAIAGSTRLQGPVTIDQLLTVNNNLNITGSLSVGGTLSISAFQTNILTIGGHIVTRGSAPSVGSGGSAVGSNGTVSISGNDASGTVAVNIGTGGGNGILAYISFVNSYTNIPHVIITPVGRAAGDFYVNRSASGFSIGVSNALAPGGYVFDYVVMQ